MKVTLRHWAIAVLVYPAAMQAVGQAPAATPAQGREPAADMRQAVSASVNAQPAPRSEAGSVPGLALDPGSAVGPGAASSTPAIRALLGFEDSDVKFRLQDLMDTLRDRRHEGWVLAAYPDPKTKDPLIGAGFTLNLPAREHAQTDPLNARPFLEPSSAELWQAAGLEPDRLQSILAEYARNMAAWKAKKYRRKIATLAPQISDDEAEQLLRVSAIQAIYNAKAYCRNFDRYSAPQQMALSQLVYQMGVNLQEFSQFLNLINSDAGAAPEVEAATPDAEYWKTVQESLIHSQWARLYRARAVAVIAMLDPGYEDSSSVAERRVSATLRPARRASLRRAVLRRGRKRKTRARKD